MDKRNQENANMLVRLIHHNRVETTTYAAKWMTILGNRVMDLAFMGPEVEEAKLELEDIFFLRYRPDVSKAISFLIGNLMDQSYNFEGHIISDIVNSSNSGNTTSTSCTTSWSLSWSSLTET